MLELDAVDAGYGPVQVLRQVSLCVAPGEILCLLGRNGAGKTTTMKAIMGLLPLTGGRVWLDGRTISDRPAHKVPGLGVGYVPQGRRLFGALSVAQNLEIGLRARGSGPAVLDHALDLFPHLKDRYRQRAETLSGGEQQMLAMARALCLAPKVLLLDEPTEGLQPSVVATIRQAVLRLRAEGVGILLVEQRIDTVLSVADRVAFLENGRLLETVAAAALRADPDRLTRRLGV